jgi:phage gp36-like protein
MSYATGQDLIDRFGEQEVINLTDRDRLGVVDATVASQALVATADEIDGYLAGRYSLPLQPVPRVLIGVACDIARYRLCGAEVNVTEDIRSRYKDAVRFLEHVAAGRISLGGMPGGGAAPVAGPAVLVSAGDSLFSRRNRVI